MTWIDNIIKHSIHYQQNFSKVWTYNSSSLTAQNFKGKKYLMFYVQLLIIANVQSPTSNLLDHFIFLRTPSSQAWQWSTEAASTSFYLVQHQVKKEIIRSLAKKMGSTQGYLGQPWISPKPSKNNIFQGFFSHAVCISEVNMSQLDIRLNIFWLLVFGI